MLRIRRLIAKYNSVQNSLMVFGILLPLSIQFSNYFFVFNLILLFISSKGKKIEWISLLILSIPALVPLLSILLHNETFTFYSFEVRLPFIATALLVGFFSIDKSIFTGFYKGIIIGSLIAVLFHFVENTSFGLALKSVSIFDFSYTPLFATISIIYLWFTKTRINDKIKVALTVLFFVSIFINGNFFFISAAFIISIAVVIVKGSSQIAKISIAVVVLITSFLLYKGPEIQSLIAPFQKTQKLGASDRLAQWQCVLEVMKGNELIGVGYSNRMDFLLNCYHMHNMNKAENLALNAHNEYLDFFLVLGYLGVIALLIYFINALFVAYDSKEIKYLLIVSLIALFSLTENVFTRQKGVMITSITYLMIYASRGTKSKEESATHMEVGETIDD